MGWKIDDGYMNQVNKNVIQSGNQIQLKVFRKSLEENAAAILTSQGYIIVLYIIILSLILLNMKRHHR